MNTKTLKALEYFKILEMLAKHATGERTKEKIQRLTPLTEEGEILDALNETDNASVALLKYASPPHCGISNQHLAVKRAMSGGILSIPELLDMARILRVCRQYKGYIDDLSEFYVLAEYIGELITYDSTEKAIEQAIRNEEELEDSASDALYGIRRSIRAMNEKIRSTLNNLITSDRYSKYLQEQIVTTRGGRYVIPVRAEYKSEINGLVHDTSSTGATLFIEPAAVVEANNKLRELEAEEKTEVQKILAQLTSLVAEDGESILVNLDCLEKLDFAFAKGKLALEMNAVMPKIRADGVCDIKKARHPLIDKSRVVPIDVRLGGEFDALIITGPNTGGKTVSIKTVGLFVLMAQSGLHIPAADGSETGLFESVYADIGDEQSIEQSLSTFSSHMTNIADILKSFGGKSLVLFDELGAGTDPTEGAALAISIIEHIRTRGGKVMATTHYSELKLYAMTTEGVVNGSCEFDVETLSPTYRLSIGVPGKSNAFEISTKIGIPKEIIQNAREHMNSENIKFEDVLGELERNRRRAQSEKDIARRMKKQLEEDAGKIEREYENIEKEKQKLIEKASDEAQKIIDAAIAETEKMLSEITELRKKESEKEAIKKLEQVRKELKGKSADHKRKRFDASRPQSGNVPPDVIPGTYVYIAETDSRGQILSPPDKKGNVMVQTGILKLTVPLTSLKLAEQNESEQFVKKYSAERQFSSKSNEISPEIDLRGLYAREAVDKAEKFIDDAAVSSLKQVTIVHGKGTGALRSAIHQMLKANKFVKSFRLGVYGEGEQGVTVVELN